MEQALVESHLDLVTTEQDDALFVVCRGTLDIETAPKLRKLIHEGINSGRRQVCLDLSEIEYCDCTGAGVFLAVLKRMRELGGGFRLMYLRGSCVDRLLSRLALSDYFPAMTAAWE